MAVDGIAGGAGVLTCDATRLRAFLQEAGLIDDQHAARVIPEVLHDVATQPAQGAPGAHGVDVPIRSIEQALYALWPRLAKMFGQLPAVLARDAIKQPDEIAPGALAHLGPCEARGDARVQCIQCFRPPRDDDRFFAHVFRDHAPSSASSRKRIANRTQVSL